MNIAVVDLVVTDIVVETNECALLPYFYNSSIGCCITVTWSTSAAIAIECENTPRYINRCFNRMSRSLPGLQDRSEI